LKATIKIILRIYVGILLFLGDKIPKAHIFRTDQKPLMADSNAIHAPSIQAI